MSFSPFPRRWRSAMTSVTDGVAAGGPGRAVVRGVVEDEHLGAERQRVALGRDRVQAADEQLALLGVDHAEGDLDAARDSAIVTRRARRRRRSLRLHAALRPRAVRARSRGRARDVRLVTSASSTARCRAREGYAVDERFYRGAPGAPGRARGVAAKLAQPRAGHARGCAGGPAARRGRRALPVARRPAARRAPAARVPAAARPHRPRRAAPRAAPGPARGAAGALRGASTRSSSTPSTARAARRGARRRRRAR